MHSRSIKVGDLLTKPGTDDLITRTSQPLPSIPNITSDNLDLTMKIHSVNHDEVWIDIIWLRCAFDEVCDYSGTDYVRTLEITAEDEESLRFSLSPEDEEVYTITSRDNTIELLDPITQLIQLYEPVSIVSPGYEFNDELEEDIAPTGNKVIFK